MRSKIKNILLISVCALTVSGCGTYKKYQRPDIAVDSLYRDATVTEDTTSLAQLSWRELFTDSYLQSLIEQGLEYNTDLRVAYLKVTEAEARLQTARLSYLPSLSAGADASTNRQHNTSVSVAASASWELDIFGKVTAAKRGAKAAWEQSESYRQAVQTQLIATIANSYYTLLMLDSQLETSRQTLVKWQETTQTLAALKQAGQTNEAAVAQARANSLAVQSSVLSLEQQVNELENSLSTLLGQSPQAIERGALSEQRFPETLSTGVPLQLLSNRPDVRQSEYALAQAFYATAQARAAFYPKITLGGSVGWFNNAVGAITNPGELLLSAVGSLVQPIFQKGMNRANLKIAKAQQEESLLLFQQSLLNAGAEVNNALTQWQTARGQIVVGGQQVNELQTAVNSTRLLMKHGTTTYLEVLTAEQSLLQAELTQTTNRFNEIQGVINLYHSLGGGLD